ncbi:hypothetical protein JCM30471_21590 [Desulfuromonas carbonis]
MRQLLAATPVAREEQDQRIGEYRRKVLETFFRHGRLEKLPAQQKKRLIVLEAFATRFEVRRRYREAEVTELITPLFEDYCTIRRLLVDAGLIRRAGASYWREEEGNPALPAPLKKEKRMPRNDPRRELKRALKQSAAPMGIYQIRCASNGRIYVAASPNLDGERNSRLFQLRMGKVVFSPELQKDLDQFGARAFTFEVLATLEPPGPGSDPKRALALLELEWLERLQPFGAQGYNSERKYRRERERFRLD